MAFVPLAAKVLLIVPRRNLVWPTSAPIHVDKLLAVPMLNVLWWTNELNVPAWQDFCPTPQRSLDVPENQQHVSPTTNAPLASNVMPDFAGPSVTVMMLACLMNSASTMFAKRSAKVTANAVPMRFAKVSSVFLAADPMQIAR